MAVLNITKLSKLSTADIYQLDSDPSLLTELDLRIAAQIRAQGAIVIEEGHDFLKFRINQLFKGASSIVGEITDKYGFTPRHPR